jgi:hypothetical protein
MPGSGEDPLGAEKLMERLRNTKEMGPPEIARMSTLA